MNILQEDRTVYFCIDTETSGPVPGLFNLISIAVVVVRWDGQRFSKGHSFYREIIPDFEGFDEETIKIHHLTPEHLKAHGQSSREVFQAIIDFVQAETKPGERALFVGHNAPFDWMFTAWYFAWLGFKNPFGYNALDTKALMMGRHGLPWKKCSKPELVCIYPQLKEPDEALVHNALADADFQADILIALLEDLPSPTEL